MIFFTFNCSVTAYYYYWPAFSINKGDFEILFIHLSRKSLWQHFLRVISETIVLFCFAFTDHFLPLPLAFFIVPNPWHSQGSLFKAITNCFLLCPDCCEIAENKSEKMAIQEKWNILRFKKKFMLEHFQKILTSRSHLRSLRYIAIGMIYTQLPGDERLFSSISGT